MKEPMQDLLELQTLEFGAVTNKDAAARSAALREKIHPQILGHYDRLRVRGKRGLVPVINQVCSGCHMRLPLAVVMALKHNEDLQLCDSCGRYLYLPEATESAADSKSPAIKPARSLRRRKKVAVATEPLAVGEILPSPTSIQPRLPAG